MKVAKLVFFSASALALALSFTGCAHSYGQPGGTAVVYGGYRPPPPTMVYGSYASAAVWGHPAGVAYAPGGVATWNSGAGYAHGYSGGTAAWNNGAGYAHTANGGTAAWGGGSGAAYGSHGGSAAWNHGTGYAEGPHGGEAAWSHGSMAFRR